MNLHERLRADGNVLAALGVVELTIGDSEFQFCYACYNAGEVSRAIRKAGGREYACEKGHRWSVPELATGGWA